MKKLLFILFFSLTINDEGQTIALVLSGGGAKGISEIPTLQIIDSLNIPIDYVIGTSMGAIGGAYYSIGYSPEEIKNIAFETDWNKIFSNQKRRIDLNYFQKEDYDKYQLEFTLNGFKPNLPIALSNGHASFSYLNKLTRHNETINNFDNFVIPFRCNATDLLSGEEIIFNEGSLSKALRCSSSIPTVFNPIDDGNHLLIDGGVLNNLGTDIAEELGADIIIAVDVSSDKKQKEDISDIFNILEQSILLNGLKKKNDNIEKADILIQPALHNYSTLDFDKNSLDSIYSIGYKAVYKKINELSKLSNHNSNTLKLASINKKKISIKSVEVNSQSNIIISDLLQQNFPNVLTKNDLINTFKKIRLSNKYNNINFEFTPIDDDYILTIDLEMNPPITINNILIEGNNKIDDSFIINILDMEKNEVLDYNKLDNKIDELYNMDFFESIRYELINLENNSADLRFTLKETNFKRLKVGGSWSSYYKLIAKLKIDLIYKPFDKFRFQNEFVYGNQLKENNLKILYTNNYNFDFRIIPLIEFNNIANNVNYYDENLTFQTENINSDKKSFGLIFPIKNYGSIELKNNKQSIQYSANDLENTSLEFYNLNIEIDKIDNILYPQNGFLLKYYYEHSSSNNYKIQKFSFDKYASILDKSSIRLYGDYLYSNDVLPKYKNINYFNPDRMLSFGEYKLYSSNLINYGIELNYRYQNSQTFRFIFNSINNVEFPINNFERNNLKSIGVGLRVKSIFGPINFLWTKSNKGLFADNYIENYYFSIGIDY